MKYREELQAGIKFVSNNMKTPDGDLLKERMKAHADMHLTPYIESMRYPVTGVSSIQPYEAKILRPKKGERQLAKHSVVVPGVPEMDLSEFDAVKTKIDSTISKLTEDLDKEYSKEQPDTDKINNLVDTIDRLDAALSGVIPKYIAHQQKLDFDGDAIELHSAKTRDARKEIEQHFKKVTGQDKSGGPTARAFRNKFTYEALVPSTGKYTLAEQQLAFQKKFPEKEGFDFLKKC
jgi:hypothetical protein